MSTTSIRKREEAATPGPWGHSVDGSLVSAESIDGDVAEVFPLRISLTDDDILDHDQKKRNAEFIAHAREDVPLLVDAVEALWKAQQELLRMIQRWGESVDPNSPAMRAVHEATQALAELERAP